MQDSEQPTEQDRIDMESRFIGTRVFRCPLAEMPRAVADTSNDSAQREDGKCVLLFVGSPELNIVTDLDAGTSRASWTCIAFVRRVGDNREALVIETKSTKRECDTIDGVTGEFTEACINTIEGAFEMMSEVEP